MRWTCDGCAMDVRWTCDGRAMNMRWTCDGLAFSRYFQKMTENHEIHWFPIDFHIFRLKMCILTAIFVFLTIFNWKSSESIYFVAGPREHENDQNHSFLQWKRTSARPWKPSNKSIMLKKPLVFDGFGPSWNLGNFNFLKNHWFLQWKRTSTRPWKPSKNQ